MNLIITSVRLCGQSNVSGLGVNNNEDGAGRGAVPLHQIVDQDVVLVQFGPGVIPAHDPLLGIDLLEHVVHMLQVFVVQEPDVSVLLVLVEGQSERIGDVENTFRGPRPEQDAHDAPEKNKEVSSEVSSYYYYLN